MPNITKTLKGTVYFGDNLPILNNIKSESVQLIYIDPPFNTGRTQERQISKNIRVPEKTKSDKPLVTGFAGKSYERILGDIKSYNDSFDDFWSFLYPRVEQAWRILNESGTLYLHLDYREAHYVKVMLDVVFGRESFLNEIIWAYDYGGKSKKKWPSKHDTILVYVKNPKKYYFDSETVDREPYMAPGLVTLEKAEKGKLPTDVWWHTIVSPTGKEKTGYPTQKPLGILRRIISASSQENDTILDFFAGSGTTGMAAAELKRNFILIDQNPQAHEVMKQRLPKYTKYIKKT